MHARSCTPPGASSPQDFLCCRQEYSPLPSDAHTRASYHGLTSPRSPTISPTAGAVHLANYMRLTYVSYQGQGPLATMQTPQRPQEDELQKTLAEALRAVNDQYRGEGCTPITRLSEDLFVGSFPSDVTADHLKELGVTHVINVVQSEHPTTPKVQSMFSVHNFDTLDSKDYYILNYNYFPFRDLVDSIRNEGGKVFVHCYAGINRSVALCVAYLMERYEMEIVDVVRHIRKAGRFYILDNVAFQRQLVEFYFGHIVTTQPHAVPTMDLRARSSS